MINGHNNIPAKQTFCQNGGTGSLMVSRITCLPAPNRAIRTDSTKIFFRIKRKDGVSRRTRFPVTAGFNSSPARYSFIFVFIQEDGSGSQEVCTYDFQSVCRDTEGIEITIPGQTVLTGIVNK